MRAIIDNANVKRFSTTLPSDGNFYLWDKKFKTDPLRKKSAVGFDVFLKVTRVKGKRFDVFASVIEDDYGNSHIDIEVVHDPSEKTHLNNLYYELGGSVRHEIEHITDEGQLAGLAPEQINIVPHLPTKGKIVHTINRRAKMLGDLHNSLSEWGRIEQRRLKDAIDGNMLSYLTCYEEVGPLTQGFFYEAKKRRCSIDRVMSAYLERLYRKDLLTDDDYDEAYNHLIGWIKATLPDAIVTD
jgi:hypothetical protein